MKTFWKRLLAVSLSAALLIGCAVSGLVLPAVAEATAEPASSNLFPGGDFDDAFSAAVTLNTNNSIDPTGGINGTPALKIEPGSGWSTSSLSITLNGTLKAGKQYIFRVKAKGGSDGEFYVGADYASSYGQILTSRLNRSETVWSELQAIFTPAVDTNKMTGFYIYNTGTTAGYMDDFRIYEYVPGMNLYPNEWEYTVPSYNSTSTSSNAFLTNNGLVYEAEAEGSSNYVYKITDTPSTWGKYVKLGSISNIGKAIPADTVFSFSFRYKAFGADDAPPYNDINAQIPELTQIARTVGEKDADGWRTYTAKFKHTKETGIDWANAITLRFNNASVTEVWVDDIFVGVTAEVDITTADQDLKQGDSLQLECTSYPLGYPVKWSSSNSAVATVDQNGKVTAMSRGTAKITADNGTGKTDVFNVNVVHSYNLLADSDLVLEIAGADGKGTSKSTSPTVTETLKAGERYVLQFKISGGSGKLYNSQSTKIDTSTENSNTELTIEAPAEGKSNEVFMFFTPLEDLTNLPGLYFYNTTQVASTTVRYTDFAVYKYTPGLNLVPGSDASVFPLTAKARDKTAVNSLFGNFINATNGLSVSLETVDNNAVWKFSGLSTAGTSKYLKDTYLKSLLEGKTFNLSFRFKGVSNADASVDILKNLVTINSKNTSDPDADGWKTFTANLTYTGTFNSTYNYGLNFTGDTDFYVDDFYLAEATEIDITQTKAELRPDEMLQLEYTATYPTTDYTVKWFSSNNAVATVDAAGRVVAKDYGRTTITAMLPSGAVDTFNLKVVKYFNLLTNGDFEDPSFVGKDRIVQGEGFNDSTAVKVTANGQGLPVTLTLSEELSTSKTYILRYKARGNLLKTYWGTYNYTSTGGPTMNASDWMITSFSFVPTEALTGKLTFSVPAQYWDATNSAPVYFDEFELFEYVPGMNLAQGDEDCIAIPCANNDVFNAWEDRMEVVNDNGNYMWKVHPSSNYDSALLNFAMTNTGITTNPNVIATGDDITVSFRYKATAGAVVISSHTNYPDTVNITTVDEEDGWIRYTATTTLQDLRYHLYFRFDDNSAANGHYVLIDDFYVGETLENFNMSTVGTSLHQRADGEIDGVRFKTRLYFGDELKVSEETGLLQMAYNGTYYDVVSMGALLKRSANENALTVENAADETLNASSATRVWKSEAYSSTTNTLKCVEKTDTYVDMAVNMMTKTPSETFEQREYDGRGYIQLQIGENVETFYTNTYTDSPIAAYNRYVASLTA